MENFIDWSDEEFSVGCKEIDEQHKILVQLLNLLYVSYFEKTEKKYLQKIISSLKSYTVFHFTTEEKLFKQNNYSLTEEHTKQHKKFVEEVQQFSERYDRGDEKLSDDILIFLKNWILNHIQIEDMKYKNELCSSKE